MKKIISGIRLNLKAVEEIHKIRPYLMILLLGKSAVTALFPFVNIYMTSAIIDGIIQRKSLQSLILYVCATVVLNAACTFALNIFTYFSNTAVSEFEHRYEMTLARKTMALDFADVEKPEIFNKKQKIMEMRNVNGGGLWKLLVTLPGFIGNIVTILVSVSLTFHLFFLHGSGTTLLFKIICSPLGSLLILTVILGSVVFNMFANAGLTKKIYELMVGVIPFNRMFGYYQDNYFSYYRAGKDIRLYNQKKIINNELHTAFQETDSSLKALGRTQFHYKGLGSLALSASNIAIYLFVGLRALAGLCSVGQIVLYLNSINQFVGGVGDFMTQWVALQTNGEALDAYFDYMEIPSHMSNGCKKTAKDTKGEYHIEFKHVTFRYPGTDRDVLKNVSFEVKFGKRTAIVGMNGSGKTTMIKLLCRLYDPQEGEILLNGINIKDYEAEEYMKLFSGVFQEYRLLSFELGQNVAAAAEYDEGKVMSAIRMAGFYERLEKMPKGLSTPLYKDFDKDGVEVSGGEAQKIAIARALYSNAPFIILDEPTAALDPIAEADIYANFAKIVKNRTALYISHRLSSCRFCDDILVFHDGRLIQEGTHDELMTDKDDKYYEMWQAQAKYYKN